MPKFYHRDDNPQRHPSEMAAMVNVMAIGGDDEFRTAFLSAHLSDQQTSGPSVLCSLWVDLALGDDREPVRVLLEAHGDEPASSMEWTLVLTPQQARATGYALLRLADGLETMIDDGEYGLRPVPDLPIYRSDPQL